MRKILITSRCLLKVKNIVFSSSNPKQQKKREKRKQKSLNNANPFCVLSINALLKRKTDERKGKISQTQFKVLRNNNIMFRYNALHYLNITASARRKGAE